MESKEEGKEDNTPIEIVKKVKTSSKKTNINDLIKLTKKRSIAEVVSDEKTSNSTGDIDSEHKKKKKNKKKNKTKSKSEGKEESANASSISADEERNTYPYEVVPDDHCETPVEAYHDISGLLTLYSQQISKPNESLFIYDPYFCEGSMKERLRSIGFANVYNQKEDFYSKIANNDTPIYDVLLTNPPYSLQHMEKLLDFVFQSQKPFCLLVPNYVYMKDYYDRLMKLHHSRFLNKQTPVFYICPKAGKRYLYTTPKVSHSLHTAL
jgi:hypothetical protein